MLDLSLSRWWTPHRFVPFRRDGLDIDMVVLDAASWSFIDFEQLASFLPWVATCLFYSSAVQRHPATQAAGNGAHASSRSVAKSMIDACQKLTRNVRAGLNRP